MPQPLRLRADTGATALRAGRRPGRCARSSTRSRLPPVLVVLLRALRERGFTLRSGTPFQRRRSRLGRRRGCRRARLKNQMPGFSSVGHVFGLPTCTSVVSPTRRHPLSRSLGADEPRRFAVALPRLVKWKLAGSTPPRCAAWRCGSSRRRFPRRDSGGVKMIVLPTGSADSRTARGAHVARDLERGRAMPACWYAAASGFRLAKRTRAHAGPDGRGRRRHQPPVPGPRNPAAFDVGPGEVEGYEERRHERRRCSRPTPARSANA